MKNYRINKNTDTNPGGHNEVHDEDCPRYSSLRDYEDLGAHYNCHSAVREAKARGYYKADCCAICSSDCHTG